MRPAEVLGIEVEHYEAADGSRTLVPKTIGLTERASGVKSVVERPNVSSNEEWFARLSDTYGEEAGKGAIKAVELFESLGCQVGPTQSRDSLFARVETSGAKFAWPLFVRHTGGGRVELRLDYLKNTLAFSEDAARREALQRLTDIKSLQVRSTDNISGMPSFPVTSLLDDVAFSSFGDFTRWLIGKLKASRS